MSSVQQDFRRSLIEATTREARFEFPIALSDYAKAKRVDSDEAFELLPDDLTWVKKQMKLPAGIRLTGDPEFLEFDSGNASHAVAYFHCTVSGDDGKLGGFLRKMFGPDYEENVEIVAT